MLGSSDSRRVPGGSFLLRAIRYASSFTRSSTIATIRGIDGLKVVADFADERILEVIHEIRGENPEYQVMKSLLPAGGTFIDVGANFGTFSLLASRLVGASGRVIAIEPQPRLVSMIHSSVSASDATSCEVIEAAAGDEDGEVELLVPLNDSGRAGLFRGFSGAKSHTTQRVRSITLDSLGLDEIHLMKIDVEGSESRVIAGGSRTIDRLHPPLLIELNPWSAQAANTSTESIIGQLARLGYDEFALAGSYPAAADVTEIPRDRQLNLVARRLANE
jgi:FkbM family methyltransferase